LPSNLCCARKVSAGAELHDRLRGDVEYLPRLGGAKNLFGPGEHGCVGCFVETAAVVDLRGPDGDTERVKALGVEHPPHDPRDESEWNASAGPYVDERTARKHRGLRLAVSRLPIAPFPSLREIRVLYAESVCNVIQAKLLPKGAGLNDGSGGGGEDTQVEVQAPAQLVVDIDHPCSVQWRGGNELGRGGHGNTGRGLRSAVRCPSDPRS
jgi:hypothetical protein